MGRLRGPPLRRLLGLCPPPPQRHATAQCGVHHRRHHHHTNRDSSHRRRSRSVRTRHRCSVCRGPSATMDECFCCCWCACRHSPPWEIPRECSSAVLLRPHRCVCVCVCMYACVVMCCAVHVFPQCTCMCVIVCMCMVEYMWLCILCVEFSRHVCRYVCKFL